MPVFDDLIHRSGLKRAQSVDVSLLEVAVSVRLEGSIKVIAFGDQIEDFVIEGADFMAGQRLLRLGKNSRLSELGLDNSQVLCSRHVGVSQPLPTEVVRITSEIFRCKFGVCRTILDQLVLPINKLLQVVEVRPIQKALVLHEVLNLIEVVFIERLLFELSQIQGVQLPVLVVLEVNRLED